MKSVIKRVVCIALTLVLLASCLPIRHVFAASSGDRLQGMNSTVYSFLKTKIRAVADGDLTSTEFVFTDTGILSWTKAELGVSAIIADGKISDEAKEAMNTKMSQHVNFKKILNCLLADCPYELYWFDKIAGAAIMPNMTATESELSITKIVFKFTVSTDYTAGSYAVNPAKISAAVNAVSKAKSIVAKHAAKSDLEKLIAYRDEICQLTSYNHAVENNPSAPYGNPWQMISVFDTDPNTKTVCEGYAKAFKYLCDQSNFDGDVICYLVDGYMQGGTGEGNHMWNVVQIGGGTLLVDVTNCDEGTAGAPDKLFLKTGQKNGQWYVIDCGNDRIYYTYSETLKDLHTNGYLELKAGNVDITPTTPATQPTAAPTTPQPTQPATQKSTEPAVTTPTATVQPVQTQPVTAKPTQPAATNPGLTQPTATMPAPTVSTAPTVTTTTTPAQTEPLVTQPSAVSPTEPAPTVPAETMPNATEPSLPVQTVQPETEQPATTPVVTEPAVDETSDNGNMIVYVIIGAAVAVAVAAAIILFVKRKKT